MPNAWYVPGWSGKVKVVRRVNLGAGEKAESARPLARNIRDWLADPFLRGSVLEIYDALCKRSPIDPARATAYELSQFVVPRVAEALELGELVIAAPKPTESSASSGEAKGAQSKETVAVPRWPVNSTMGPVFVTVRDRSGKTEVQRVARAEQFVDGWMRDPRYWNREALVEALDTAGEQVGWITPVAFTADQTKAKLIEYFEQGLLGLLRLKSGEGNSESGGSAANNEIGEGPAQDAKKSGGSETGKPTGGAGSGKDSKSETTKEKPPEPPKTLTWIRIELVDEDGNELSDEEYDIKLTDGKSAKGKWPKGAKGLYFDQIPEGMCKIKFPKLKDNGWKAPGKK